MDNRDTTIKCEYYRPGCKHTTTNKRVIGKRMRTIHCDCGSGARISLEFHTIAERIDYCKKHCKQNWRSCRIAQIMHDQQEGGRK